MSSDRVLTQQELEAYEHKRLTYVGITPNTQKRQILSYTIPKGSLKKTDKMATSNGIDIVVYSTILEEKPFSCKQGEKIHLYTLGKNDKYEHMCFKVPKKFTTLDFLKRLRNFGSVGYVANLWKIKKGHYII